MKLADLDLIRELSVDLNEARSVLAAFEECPDETVSCHASLAGPAFRRTARITLLPIPKSQAVSAAKREVDKVAQQLVQLGVTVDVVIEDTPNRLVYGTVGP